MTEGEALSAFVAGTISFNALRRAIEESTDFRFQPGGGIQVTSRRPLPRTTISAEDVRRVLMRYQDGQLTLEEVSIWGVVLNALDAFELQGMGEPDAEEVWDVVAQLSVASINTAFTPERVSALVDRVDRLVK
jgi:hypothetical protein